MSDRLIKKLESILIQKPSDAVTIIDAICKIKQLQDEVERIHKLGRERASDIADYRDEVKQLQDEIAELKNNPADPWQGVLNEDGDI